MLLLCINRITIIIIAVIIFFTIALTDSELYDWWCQIWFLSAHDAHTYTHTPSYANIIQPNSRCEHPKSSITFYSMIAAYMWCGLWCYLSCFSIIGKFSLSLSFFLFPLRFWFLFVVSWARTLWSMWHLCVSSLFFFQFKFYAWHVFLSISRQLHTVILRVFI